MHKWHGRGLDRRPLLLVTKTEICGRHRIGLRHEKPQENLGGIRVIVDVLWKLFTRRQAQPFPSLLLNYSSTFRFKHRQFKCVKLKGV